MRAVQFSRFGGPEVLEVIDCPTPEVGPGQVRVAVKAVGVNLAEALMRENRYAITPPLPSIPGSEVAGVVEAVGEGVSELAPGMRVAVPMFASGAHFGGYADAVVVDAAGVVPLPEALSFQTATALMIQGITALLLTQRFAPQGRTVMISAAAGGVGSLLVQLAKQAGARKVIAAASTPEKLNLALGLGADVGVNYAQPGWTNVLRDATGGAGPDLIFESVGGAVTGEALAALAPGGQLVIYGALNIQQFQMGVPELVELIFRNQSISGFAMPTLLTPEVLKAGLAELFALAVAGRLQVTIGGEYALAHAAEAHRALEGRRSMGKLVLLP